MSIGEDTPVYMISLVARLANVHPQTLRFYETEGFIKPSRTQGKTRIYSQKDLEKIKRIVRLTRERKINLSGTKFILKLEDEIEMFFKAISDIMDDNTVETVCKVLDELDFEVLDTESIKKNLRGG